MLSFHRSSFIYIILQGLQVCTSVHGLVELYCLPYEQQKCRRRYALFGGAMLLLISGSTISFVNDPYTNMVRWPDESGPLYETAIAVIFNHVLASLAGGFTVRD